jgi:hypothetical protein
MGFIYRGYPFEGIQGLREGDYFFEEKIIKIMKQFGYYKMTAESGAVYTAHFNDGGYNIFRRIEPTKYEKRRIEQKRRRAERN